MLLVPVRHLPTPDHAADLIEERQPLAALGGESHAQARQPMDVGLLGAGVGRWPCRGPPGRDGLNGQGRLANCAERKMSRMK